MPKQLVDRQNLNIRQILLQKYGIVQLDLKSVKVPAACNEFHKISAKDKDGHLPYLYES
jgi:hypothetical protein